MKGFERNRSTKNDFRVTSCSVISAKIDPRKKIERRLNFGNQPSSFGDSRRPELSLLLQCCSSTRYYCLRPLLGSQAGLVEEDGRFGAFTLDG